MYSYFRLAGAELTLNQFQYVDNLFSNANDIITLFQEIESSRGTRFLFPLSRLMVSELNTWRYGFFKIKSGRLRLLVENGEAGSKNLLSTFDDYFGKVQEHRNVLQHFGEYLYGDQKPANVKRQELRRLNASVTIAPGGSIAGFYNNYVGERFCSSDRSGDIQDVYIGSYVPLRVVGMLSLLCEVLSAKDTKFNLIMGLSIGQYDTIRQGSVNDIAAREQTQRV